MDRVTKMQTRSPTVGSKVRVVAGNLAGPAPAGSDDLTSTQLHRLVLGALDERQLARMPAPWHAWY